MKQIKESGKGTKDKATRAESKEQVRYTGGYLLSINGKPVDADEDHTGKATRAESKEQVRYTGGYLLSINGKPVDGDGKK